MAKRPQMSRAEMEVARIVWQCKRATAREVHDVLAQQRQIDFNTVQTYLTRLEQKGYLKSIKDGRTKVFSARANQRRVIRDTLQEMVQLLFDGDAVPMMRHLIEDNAMTAEEVDALRQLLDELDTPETDAC